MRIIAHRPGDECSTALLQFARLWAVLLSSDGESADAAPASSAIGSLVQPPAAIAECPTLVNLDLGAGEVRMTAATARPCVLRSTSRSCSPNRT